MSSNRLTIYKEKLHRLYVIDKKSTAEIASFYRCSQNKVNYWLSKYAISKRTISEGVYVKSNPHGNPFKIQEPKNFSQAILHGIGLGLYWGEGTKSNKASIRLANTNPKLIRKFLLFLERSFSINKDKLRFGLQVFNDISPSVALRFWKHELRAKPEQFHKVIVSAVRGPGTYKNKSQYGVLTIYYNNKKLRDILCQMIEKL